MTHTNSTLMKCKEYKIEKILVKMETEANYEKFGFKRENHIFFDTI
jgi:hypothetical protein